MSFGDNHMSGCCGVEFTAKLQTIQEHAETQSCWFNSFESMALGFCAKRGWDGHKKPKDFEFVGCLSSVLIAANNETNRHLPI
jgi:hypothetical protein